MTTKLKSHIRLLQVFKALTEHPLIGMSNKEVAEAAAVTPVQGNRMKDLTQFQ